MLMLAKLSLKSFICNIIDVFCFPDAEIKQIYGIYDYYHIEKCFLYQNLTNTDSTWLVFIFICKLNCFISESEARKTIFKCMKKSKIAKRLDVSDEFWKQYENDLKTKKVMGLYEVENIENQNICTIAINRKEYVEKFKNRKINKKHKGVRRDTPRVNFESYANRINLLRQIDCKKEEKKLTQKRLQVKNTNMTMTSLIKHNSQALMTRGIIFLMELFLCRLVIHYCLK